MHFIMLRAYHIAGLCRYFSSGPCSVCRPPKIIITGVGPEAKPGVYLPPEIVLEILQNLASEIVLRARSFLEDLPYRTSDFDLLPTTSKRGAGFYALGNALLTCRAWHSVGTELLYSQPLLIYPEHIRLFRRTIDESPSLACLVKNLAIVGSPGSPLWPKKGSSRKERKELENIKGNIVQILNKCPSLQDLSANISNPYDYTTSHFPLETRRISHTRKLSVYGVSLKSIAHLTDFENLEVICAYSPQIPYTFRFPPLPRVHTLQLYQPMLESAFEFDTLDQTFPSLTTLEIYRDTMSPVTSGMFDPSIFAYLPTLRNLNYIETPEIHDFDVWKECPTMEYIEEMVVGVIGKDWSESIGNWKFPKSLERLTLFVTIDTTCPSRASSSSTPESKGAKESALDQILQCLRHNLRVDLDQQRSYALNRLVISAANPSSSIFKSGLPEHVRVVMDQIKELCLLRDVEFELRRVGEFTL